MHQRIEEGAGAVQTLSESESESKYWMPANLRFQRPYVWTPGHRVSIRINVGHPRSFVPQGRHRTAFLGSLCTIIIAIAIAVLYVQLSSRRVSCAIDDHRS